jgi:hypothetical protein
MCEQCQQLQARVAQLEAALRYYADDRRWPVQPGEDRVPRADPDIAADALAATASPLADVVRAAVELQQSDDAYNALIGQAHKEMAETGKSGDDGWEASAKTTQALDAARWRYYKARGALPGAVAALLEAQPGVWE